MYANVGQVSEITINACSRTLHQIRIVKHARLGENVHDRNIQTVQEPILYGGLHRGPYTIRACETPICSHSRIFRVEVFVDARNYSNIARSHSSQAIDRIGNVHFQARSIHHH